MLAIKKNEIISAATWMGLEIVTLKFFRNGKRNTMWYYLHVWPKIWYKWTYLPNRNRPTDIENKFMVTYGEGNGNSLQCSCLENPREGGAWQASVGSHRVGHDWSDLAARGKWMGRDKLGLWDRQIQCTILINNKLYCIAQGRIFHKLQ